MKLCKRCKRQPEFEHYSISIIRLRCPRCGAATHYYEAFAPQNIGAAIDAVVAEWNAMNIKKGDWP